MGTADRTEHELRQARASQKWRSPQKAKPYPVEINPEKGIVVLGIYSPGGDGCWEDAYENGWQIETKALAFVEPSKLWNDRARRSGRVLATTLPENFDQFHQAVEIPTKPFFLRLGSVETTSASQKRSIQTCVF